MPAVTLTAVLYGHGFEVDGTADPKMQTLPAGMPLLHTGNASRPERDAQAALSVPDWGPHGP